MLRLSEGGREVEEQRKAQEVRVQGKDVPLQRQNTAYSVPVLRAKSRDPADETLLGSKRGYGVDFETTQSRARGFC